MIFVLHTSDCTQTDTTSAAGEKQLSVRTTYRRNTTQTVTASAAGEKQLSVRTTYRRNATQTVTASASGEKQLSVRTTFRCNTTQTASFSALHGFFRSYHITPLTIKQVFVGKILTKYCYYSLKNGMDTISVTAVIRS